MDNLFSLHKGDYVKKKKNTGICTLCEILNKNECYENLLIYKNKYMAISINLYPYNSGHLIIFPKRHICDPRNFNANEQKTINLFTNISLDILEKNYQPSGFNIGYNIGEFSGASIKHLHLHIIPRYINELGVIDIIGGAKIIIEDPAKTCDRLRKAFQNI